MFPNSLTMAQIINIYHHSSQVLSTMLSVYELSGPILFAIQAMKVHQQKIEPMTIIVNSRKGLNDDSYYSKTCVKRPLKNRQNKHLNEKL